jgi:hypothetical protein
MMGRLPKNCDLYTFEVLPWVLRTCPDFRVSGVTRGQVVIYFSQSLFVVFKDIYIFYSSVVCLLSNYDTQGLTGTLPLILTSLNQDMLQVFISPRIVRNKAIYIRL